MNEQEATERIDETIAKYRPNKHVDFIKIGTHNRASGLWPSNSYSWIHLSELSLFQEEEGGPYYGSDGNVYELKLS